MGLYEEELYEETSDDESDEYAGYTVIDENEEYRKRLMRDDEVEEVTIATPIPQNEQTVLVDNARFALLKTGQALDLVIEKEADICRAAVFVNGQKVADLKAAYVKKLLAERGGMYVWTSVHEKNPPMVKLLFLDKMETGAIKLPNA